MSDTVAKVTNNQPIIKKNAKKSDMQLAKEASMGFWNRDHDNVIVTLPGGSVFLDTTPEELREYCERNKQRIVEVKKNGKMLDTKEEKSDEELAAEQAAKVQAELNKRAKKVNLPEGSTLEEIEAAEQAAGKSGKKK